MGRNRDIADGMMPVGMVKKNITIEGTPFVMGRKYQIIGNDNTSITVPLEYARTNFIREAMMDYYSRMSRPENGKPRLIGRLFLPGDEWKVPEKRIIRYDEDNNLKSYASQTYTEELRSYAPVVLGNMDMGRRAMPIRMPVEMQCTILRPKRVRFTLIQCVDWVVDMLVAIGIMESEKQVQSFDGSRITAEYNGDPGIEVILRSMK